MEMETNQILTELKYYYRYYKCLVFDYYFTMIDTTNSNKQTHIISLWEC